MNERQHDLHRLALLSKTDLTNPNQVRASALKMEQLLLREGVSTQGINLDDDSVHRLQQIYERFETDLEYDFADRVINGQTSSERDYSLYGRFLRLTQAESTLAGIRPSDKILFIGSGSFPISAILLSTLNSAKIDCYDKSADACTTSQKVVDKLGLSDRITVLNSSGEDGSVYGYDVIIVALLAQPKSRIMANVWFHAPGNVRVICRNPEDNRRFFYKGVYPQSLTAYRHFALVDEHKAQADDTISSLLIKVDRDPDKH